MSTPHYIGITGGIGSGKSYVCRLLEQRGVSVYDCDAAAKRLMRSSAELRQALTSLIGDDAYVSSGSAGSTESSGTTGSSGSAGDEPFVLNKAVVARFLLASAENAKAIDDIVHPAVAADFIGSGMQWLESAILFQSGFDRRVPFHAVICVTAPEEVRLQRIMARDGISRHQAQQWVAKQWPQQDIVSRSDYEIINDGQQPLLPQIEQILNQVKTSCN